MENELAVILIQSGIEKSIQTKISELLNTFFNKADEWKSAINELTITEPTETGKMKVAKSIRLDLKNKRVEGEKLIKQQRDIIKQRMSSDVLEDKTWLRTGQMMEDTYKHLESIAEQKEKFGEVWEANRILQLRSDRADILRNEPQIDKYIPYGIDLGIMSDEDFTNILNGAKLQRDAQKAAYEKAESERLALLKRQEDERIAQEKEREEQRIATEKENERLRLEAIEKDKALKIEREKAQKEKEEQDEINRKEREESARKLKEAQVEKEKTEAILKAKQDKEEQEKADKIRSERMAKKKAASASDNEKIEKFINEIGTVEIPICSDVDAIIAVNKAKEILKEALEILRSAITKNELFTQAT